MLSALISLTEKILPHWIYQRLIGDWNREGFHKYFANTSWMFLARIITFITSFLTMAMVARYLGPENLGKISYAQSFVSILSVFASLGIDQILYRDLTAEPERENEFIGTAVLSKLFFGLFAFIASIGLSISLNNEPLLTLLIGITAFTFLINPIGTVGTLFQSQVKARYASEISIFIAFFIPALKVLIIIFDKGIIYFSILLIVEAIIIATWSIYVYITKFNGSPIKWKFKLDVFKKLMKDSWPFLFAGLFTYIYARIDQVMLQHYLGSTSVGLYDTAVKLTNIWSFFPALIITSLFPAIIKAKSHNKNSYLERFGSLIALVITITFIITLIVFIFSKLIVLILFGGQFIDAITPLRIYIWSGLASILGILVQQYLIAENRGWVHLILTLCGAVLNIVLNLTLIPLYGISGAAVSTLIAFSLVPLGLLLFPTHRQDVFNMFSYKHRVTE